MKTSPIAPTTPLTELIPERFLTAMHLIDAGLTEITATIAKVQLEEVEPRPNQVEMKPVIYFETRPRTPYLLANKTDRDTLRESYHATTAGDLIGLKIVIGLDEFKGHAVLRIKPPRRQEPTQE